MSANMCSDCGMRWVQCDKCNCCSACCDCDNGEDIQAKYIIQALDALNDIFARRDQRPPIERKYSRRFRGKMDE